MHIYCFALLLVFVAGSAAGGTNINIASLNAKSDSSTDVTLIAQQVSELTSSNGVDIWVVQEVQSWRAALALKNGAASGGPRSARWHVLTSRYVQHGPGGRGDLLAIAYRSDMLSLLETVSVNSIMINNAGGWNARMRPMFSLRLKSKSEDSEFWVATVHLKCCGNGKTRRKLQSDRIVSWVDDKSEAPLLILGDFNIPIPVDREDGPDGSLAFNVLSSALSWLRPSNPVATQVQGSMLDASFHRNMLAWSPRAKVLLAQEDLSDLEDNDYSDHRPILVAIKIP